MSPTTTQIVEHIVLFKVKPDADPSKVTAMVDGLNGLISIDRVLHLTAGPLRTPRPCSLTFTHMLHSRYKNKDDVNAFLAHSDHLNVAKELIRPVVEDAMAVDWIAVDLAGPVVPGPGSVMRVTLLKLKEGLEAKEREKVLGVIGGMKNQFPTIDEITFGENISPERAKGFSIGSIAIFSGLRELEALDSDTVLVSSQKEKVSDLIESEVVVDYVISSPI